MMKKYLPILLNVILRRLAKGYNCIFNHHKTAQKIRLSADFLTEYNVDALNSDLSTNTISQYKDNVKDVDLAGIEPANSEFSGPNVYQHQAHTNGIISNEARKSQQFKIEAIT